MAAGSGTADDEWEYEYSTTETETFLVDLDLTSVNGVIKSKNAGERKTLKGPGKSKESAAASKNSGINQANDVEDGPNQDDGDDYDEGAVIEQMQVDPALDDQSRAQGAQQERLPDNDHASRIQILDLDTTNPIVSYEGNIYSCTWHDVLGTSMFISKHQEAPFHEPDISTDDYDLIGTTRIKLIGQRATVVPKATSKKRSRDENDDDAADQSILDLNNHALTPNGRSLGTIRRTNPKTNIEIKQQASFLEKLMEVKKSRGEFDTVRTFVDRHSAAADARRALKAKQAKEKGKSQEETKEQRLRREIHELNKRVVKGDNNALERLQEIYADMEEVVDEDEDEVVLIGKATNTAFLHVAPSTAGGASTSDPPAAAATPHVADS